MRSLLLLSLFSLSACGGEEPKPAAKKEAKAEKPSCALSFDGLADTTWLRMNPESNKKDVQSRIRFMKDGDKIKANYSAGSVGDVYTYACTVNGGTMTCLEEELHAEAWCKSYAAVHDGVCDPAAVAQQLSVSVDVMKPIADKVNKELKGLKGEEKENQRKADNNPNNKIRSRFVVAVDKGKCELTVQDKFLTMFNGAVQEYENVNGTSNFVKDDGEYFWQSCTDMGATVVDDAGKEVAGPYSPGTLKFQAGLGDKQKADGACTYTADIWADWSKSTADVPGTVAGGKVTFSTAIPFANPGVHALYFQRYKTCDGKKEEIGLACKAFRVQ